MRAMIIAVITAFAVVAVTQCSAARADSPFYFMVGAGPNTNIFGGDTFKYQDGIGAELEIGVKVARVPIWGDPMFYGRFIHVSQWDEGPPFNDNDEASLDRLSFGLCWGNC